MNFFLAEIPENKSKAKLINKQIKQWRLQGTIMHGDTLNYRKLIHETCAEFYKKRSTPKETEFAEFVHVQ